MKNLRIKSGNSAKAAILILIISTIINVVLARRHRRNSDSPSGAPNAIKNNCHRSISTQGSYRPSTKGVAHKFNSGTTRARRIPIVPLLMAYVFTLAPIIFFIHEQIAWPIGIFTPAIFVILGVLSLYILLDETGKSDDHTARQRRPLASPAILGQVIVISSLGFAFVLQAQYTASRENVYLPGITIAPLGEEAGKGTSISITTAVRSPYFTCSTSTRVRFELARGHHWTRGQIIGVGVSSLYDIDSVDVQFDHLYGEPVPVAPTIVARSDDNNSIALRIDNPPPDMILGTAADLIMTIKADWGLPRGLGSCTVLLPRLSPQEYGGLKAYDAFELAGITDKPYLIDIQPVISGESKFDTGVNVLRQEALPAPTQPADNIWNCAPSATDDTVPDCSALVPTEDPAADNLRNGLLLLCGTLLAFGLQVTYDNMKRSP